MDVIKSGIWRNKINKNASKQAEAIQQQNMKNGNENIKKKPFQVSKTTT